MTPIETILFAFCCINAFFGIFVSVATRWCIEQHAEDIAVLRSMTR